MNIYQIAALLIMSVFYSAYIIKQLSLKKHGIKTDRLAKGEKNSQTRNLEKWLLAVTFSMPLFQLGSVFFQNKLPLAFHLPIYVTLLGIIIAALGVFYFLCAIIAMRNNWRAGIDKSQKTEMVTSGIYKYSRNPAFVGFDLFYIGIALMFPTSILVSICILAIMLFHMQILEEEKFLPDVFGKEYLNYKKSTRRY